MKRWHEEQHIAKREWKKHRTFHVEMNKGSNNRIGLDPQLVDCRCDEQVGRFRKKDAHDCGNTRCGICHSDKYPKRSKHEHEIISEIDFEEQVKEMKNNKSDVLAEVLQFLEYIRDEVPVDWIGTGDVKSGRKEDVEWQKKLESVIEKVRNEVY